MRDRLEHIEAELLQAYLEGEAGERSVEVVNHLAACPRCSEELEGWRVLFRDLEALPALGPTPALGKRVMAQIRSANAATAPLPLRERILSLIPGVGARGACHPAPSILQELADGRLTGPELGAARAHLAACAACEGEAEAWRGLVAALSRLPELHPSEGFATRVMGNFRAREATRSASARPSENRLLAAARWILPTTRGGWITASTLAAAPAIGFLALMGLVAAHPLLTLADLFAFFGWQAPSLARSGFSRVVQEIAGSGYALQAYETVQLLLAAPRLLAVAAGLTWLATVTAGWVLYRNVITPSFTSRHRVRTG